MDVRNVSYSNIADILTSKAKGWSYRTIYKMVQFYETYSTKGFEEMVHHYGMQHYLSDMGSIEQPSKAKPIVPIGLAQISDNAIVPIQSAQIPSVLFSTGWSNHQSIIWKGDTAILKDERLHNNYYMVLKK